MIAPWTSTVIPRSPPSRAPPPTCRARVRVHRPHYARSDGTSHARADGAVELLAPAEPVSDHGRDERPAGRAGRKTCGEAAESVGHGRGDRPLLEEPDGLEPEGRESRQGATDARADE